MENYNVERIMNMEVTSNSELLPSEKETQININNEGVSIHTDHRTGIKWCRQQIKDNNATINYIHTQDNKLVGISINVDYNLVSLKSVPRKINQISSIFSI